jgi:hypothetical protein
MRLRGYCDLYCLFSGVTSAEDLDGSVLGEVESIEEVEEVEEVDGVFEAYSCFSATLSKL